jgi:predicted phosphodiesterase
MRVATLYDLLGNLRALGAVLQETPDVATIVVGGDVCAGGTHPSETLERLRALGERVLWLRGNADRELTPGEEGLAPAEVIDAPRAALTAEQIAFLYRLPPTVQIGDLLFCHATPRNDLDIFTERTPEERIVDLFAHVDADVVVCGHTHRRAPWAQIDQHYELHCFFLRGVRSPLRRTAGRGKDTSSPKRERQPRFPAQERRLAHALLRREGQRRQPHRRRRMVFA